MYYVYYGGGLIGGLMYILLGYGIVKLLTFLTPVFIALAGLLFFWAVAINGMKEFLLRSIKAFIASLISGALIFLCFWGSKKALSYSNLLKTTGYILLVLLIAYFIIHLCICIYNADPVDGYDYCWFVIALIELIADIAMLLILPKIDALCLYGFDTQMAICLFMIIPLFIVSLVRKQSFTTISMVNAIPFLISIPVYYYMEGTIPSLKDEIVIFYAILAGINLLFSIIAGSINQYRISKTNRYHYSFNFHY